MDLRKAMTQALEFEKKGNRLYSQHASETKNSLVKKVFEYLAAQEIFHIKEIEAYLVKEKIEFKLLGDKEAETKKFFQMTTQEFNKKLSMSDSDIKAYEEAMNLETSAYNYYKQLLSETQHKDTIKFLKFLMEQEDAHFKLIQNAFEYTKDPVSYNASEEQWMFEG